MSDTLIVGLLSLVGTSVGTIGGIVASQKLVSYRLAQLEEKVNKHNNLIERMFVVEGKVNELQHDVKDLKGGFDMNQNRLKSPVVWMAIAAQIVSILIVLGVIDTGMGETINALAGSVCELLVLFGVLNNPTNPDEF